MTSSCIGGAVFELVCAGSIKLYIYAAKRREKRLIEARRIIKVVETNLINSIEMFIKKEGMSGWAFAKHLTNFLRSFLEQFRYEKLII